MLSREQALELIRQHTTKRSIIYHMLAVEAIMAALARHLGEDEQLWVMTGLLHDIDFEKTEKTPERHALVAADMLGNAVPEEALRAIKAHNFAHTGVEPQTKMEKGLIAADALSGLLIACALVMPSKRLADVRVETVAKKFRDRDFARGADRERILFCEQIGVPRERFFEIGLEGLKGIAAQIGL